jgi:hypothetical protein
MTDATSPAAHDADAAQALMRHAGLPLEPGRGEGLAARTERFRAALRTLDRYVTPDVEPIGPQQPRPR